MQEYKSQANLQCQVLQLFANQDNVVVDTNVESFQFYRGQGDSGGVIVAMDRGSRAPGMSIDSFSELVRAQRIDGIWLGVRDSKEHDSEDRAEPPLQPVYQYVKRDYDEILPRLYIGSAHSSKQVDRFDCIVNCTDNLKCWTVPPNNEHSVIHVQTGWSDHAEQRIDDDDDGKQQLSVLTGRMHEWLSAGKRVLIHCEEGKSRSAALVMAYLVLHHKKQFPTADDALAFLQLKRPLVCPNKGFLAQLSKLQNVKK